MPNHDPSHTLRPDPPLLSPAAASVPADFPEPPATPTASLLPGLFGAGFECSSHRTVAGRRLDLIAATGHDRFAARDYARLPKHGFAFARDGLRWHLIEQERRRFDFTEVLPRVRAAAAADVLTIWDLCHYGWPDHRNIFRPEFVEGLAELAREFVRWHREETGRLPVLAPLNEPSFFAWAGGQVGLFHPGKRRRGDELKAQLVRAAIAASRAAREVDARVRLVHTDPIIHVAADPACGRARRRAAAYHEA